MIKKNLKEIASMVGGRLVNDTGILKISGVSINSREISPGNLFIPIVGENFDGHNFLEDAISNEAIASLWQEDKPLPQTQVPLVLVKDTTKALQDLARQYRESLKGLKLIGITGSNGKTSTKDILVSLLKDEFSVVGTKGNYNNHLGVPLTILSFSPDTNIGVVEMGVSDFGEMELLASIAHPDLVVVTNIGEAHIEDFKSKENIAKSKLKVLDYLRPRGKFIYNGDSQVLKDLKGLYENIDHRSFGLNKDNDYFVTTNNPTENGSLFSINNEDFNFKLPLLGSHQVLNAMAGIIISRDLGISNEKINEGFQNLKLTKYRQELVKAQGYDILNDAYNSNPSSLKAGLDSFYSLGSYGRKIAIIGDMLGLGEKSLEMHLSMADYIDPNQVDYLVTIGNFTRSLSEKLKDKFPERVFHFEDKMDSLEVLEEIIIKNSLVLLKASRSFQLEDLEKLMIEKIKR